MLFHFLQLCEQYIDTDVNVHSPDLESKECGLKLMFNITDHKNNHERFKISSSDMI